MAFVVLDKGSFRKGIRDPAGCSRNYQNPGVFMAACMLTKFKLNNPINVSLD